MLQLLNQLTHYTLFANHEKIGKIEQFILEDSQWLTRFAIIKSSGWLKKKDFLISPQLISSTLHEQQNVMTSIPRDQLENSPDIRSIQPVSKLMESRYLDYYHWPSQWSGVGIWGASPSREGLFGAENRDAPSDIISPELEKLQENPGAIQGSDSGLWLSHEVLSYEVKALDRICGQMRDFIVDEDWKIKYFVIDLSKMNSKKMVWVPCDWVDSLSWIHRQINLNLLAETLLQTPEFNSGEIGLDVYEKAIQSHYPPARVTFPKKTG